MKNLLNKCPAVENNKCFVSNIKCNCKSYKQCETYQEYIKITN